MPRWSIIVVSVVGACALCIALFFLLRPKYIAYKYDEADSYLVNEFRRCNVMVFGKKGSGKDVIFAHVIALRNEKHYSNIPYDCNTEVIQLREIAAGDNTFIDCINGTIRKFEPRFDEGCDIYVSDAGVYFPSSLYKVLDELYPSLPVFMALSRHLYNLNVHTNCQAFERPWIKIREQADSYIQVLRTVFRDDCLLVHIVGYDRYKDAESERNPAVKYTVRVPIGELLYDSRHFKTVFFDLPPSARERIMKKISRRVDYGKLNRKVR